MIPAPPSPQVAATPAAPGTRSSLLCSPTGNALSSTTKGLSLVVDLDRYVGTSNAQPSPTPEASSPMPAPPTRVHPMVTRTQTGSLKAKNPMSLAAVVDDSTEPTCYSQAAKHPRAKPC